MTFLVFFSHYPGLRKGFFPFRIAKTFSQFVIQAQDLFPFLPWLFFYFYFSQIQYQNIRLCQLCIQVTFQFQFFIFLFCRFGFLIFFFFCRRFQRIQQRIMVINSLSYHRLSFFVKIDRFAAFSCHCIISDRFINSVYFNNQVFSFGKIRIWHRVAVCKNQPFSVFFFPQLINQIGRSHARLIMYIKKSFFLKNI